MDSIKKSSSLNKQKTETEQLVAYTIHAITAHDLSIIQIDTSIINMKMSRE